MFRFRGSEKLKEEVERLVKENPEDVCHIAEALQFLATPSNIENDIPEVLLLLSEIESLNSIIELILLNATFLSDNIFEYHL